MESVIDSSDLLAVTLIPNCKKVSRHSFQSGDKLLDICATRWLAFETPEVLRAVMTVWNKKQCLNSMVAVRE